MRVGRTESARTRAATLAGIGVIAAGVALLGLTRHSPPAPEVVHGPAPMYSSTENEGRDLATRRPKPQMQANAQLPAATKANTFTARLHRPPPIREPQIETQSTARPALQDAGAVSALIARFPVLAHEAFASDPAAGTEAQYFARLGNLLNGTPIPAEQPVPAVADHLARAQLALDRGDLAGAVAQARQVSGGAAGVMASWIRDAETQLSNEHERTSRRTRMAENTPRSRAWPDVMPTEIPSYARQSTGPAG